MRHLPEWVQVKSGTSLWSGPDKTTVAFTSLPAWTFLHVVGLENDRLEVEYAGDGGQRQPGLGWVAMLEVQPSDPSGTWLSNFRPTQLFDTPTAATPSVGAVPQFSSMLVLGPAQADRSHVRLYSPDFKSIVGEGWVPSRELGPTGAPQRAVRVKQVIGDGPASPFASHEELIQAVGEAARASKAQTGVPASVTVAQAILESDWGQSLLSREANNYFGIKAMGSAGNDGAVWMNTMEFDGRGRSYYTLDPFRAYKSLVDSVTDHSLLFVRVGLYRAAMQATDNPNEFARRIAAAGYSTDPAYPSKIIGLMQKYDLYRFDA
jgi:hypothetical protein